MHYIKCIFSAGNSSILPNEVMQNVSNVFLAAKLISHLISKVPIILCHMGTTKMSSNAPKVEHTTMEMSHQEFTNRWPIVKLQIIIEQENLEGFKRAHSLTIW